jgi:benzoylsuccinyl-CoA thiolase BbsB subunit
MRREDLSGVRIAGAGMTPFGRLADVSADELAQRAALAALDDAGIAPGAVDSAFFGHVFAGRVAGQRVLRRIGIEGRPVMNVENACASGATALRLALLEVATGRADVALAVGFDKLTALGRGVIPPDPHDLEGALGRTNPATYALMAKRHMAEYGTTAEQLALVAVKARAAGAHNPRAQVRAAVTVEEVLSARMIADPLTRWQCCPTGDGAAAVVVTAADRSHARSVRVLASALRGGTRRPRGDRMVNHPVTTLTAQDAYRQAGIGPEDVDMAEVHDAFTIAELVHTEDLGFCKPGEGGKYLQSGATAPDGERPVNPGGGLLARGHPLGATGLAQVVELVAQLRGEAGAQQAGRPRIALAQCEGGVVYGLDAGLCAIHILAV